MLLPTLGCFHGGAQPECGARAVAAGVQSRCAKLQGSASHARDPMRRRPSLGVATGRALGSRPAPHAHGPRSTSSPRSPSGKLVEFDALCALPSPRTRSRTHSTLASCADIAHTPHAPNLQPCPRATTTEHLATLTTPWYLVHCNCRRSTLDGRRRNRRCPTTPAVAAAISFATA